MPDSKWLCQLSIGVRLFHCTTVNVFLEQITKYGQEGNRPVIVRVRFVTAFRDTFQSIGSSPVMIEMLSGFVTAGVILAAVALSILAEILSGPLDFVGSMLQRG